MDDSPSADQVPASADRMGSRVVTEASEPRDAVQVEHGEIIVGAVRSPYCEAGPRAANRAAVFVHGNPGSSRDWADLVAGVGRFARAVAFDMPGFGRADKPADFPYTVEGYAAYLDGALNQLGVDEAHLVLHDFGGPWGLAWASGRPESLRSLVLVNTGVLAGYRWHYLARIWRTPLLGELVQAATTRRLFRLALRHGNLRPLPSSFVDEMYDNYDWGTRRAVLALYRATNPGNDLARRLDGLDVPVLVVWGARDPYIPLEQAHRQREVFPDAEVCVLPDSGHWPFQDAPDAVAGVVLPFLEANLGRS